ncbi:MAG: type IV pilin N-terminal domain-containing protein [Methermicoccaceae archaeon]
MRRLKRILKDEGAVSPVIGVMLMVVVTIILAAVVSGFASGVGGGMTKAPSAQLDVNIDMAVPDTMGGTKQVMTFEHLSGDQIPTRDLQIITYYTVPSNGTVIKHVTDKNSPKVDIYGYGSYTRVPFLNDNARVGYSSNDAAHFGNFTLMAGDIMSTGNAVGMSTVLGFNISNSDYGFERGSTVDVKILHVPSGKYIFDKEVQAE